MNRSVSFEQAIQRIQRRRVRVEALDHALTERARQLAREAHTDPQMVFHHAHNANVARNAGRPWREVNYDKVDQLLAVEQRIFRLWRRYDKWSSAFWHEAYHREFVTPMQFSPNDNLG